MNSITLKNLIAISMIALLFTSCKEDDIIIDDFLPDNIPAPFLKVGNIFTYQCGYDVECGYGYCSDIMNISIDSIAIVDDDTIYYGTETYFTRNTQ